MAQAGSITRKIVLPNPQLIRCRSAACSQLWKQDSDEGDLVYPAQVLTDFVKGEVVGLTAVYDKSVSTEEIRAAINRFYGNLPPVIHSDSMSTWRIEKEQFAISIFDGTEGAKELTYLKFVTYTPGEARDVPVSRACCAHRWMQEITVEISPLRSLSCSENPRASKQRSLRKWLTTPGPTRTFR